MEALDGVIASVTRNGEPSSIKNMPFELNLEVLPLHPTFRRTEDAGPPAVPDRAGPRRRTKRTPNR